MIINRRDLDIATNEFYKESFYISDSYGYKVIDMKKVMLSFKNTFFLLISKGLSPVYIDNLLRALLRGGLTFRDISLGFLYEGLYKTFDTLELTFKSYLLAIVKK
jgi:hypothetical protein